MTPDEVTAAAAGATLGALLAAGLVSAISMLFPGAFVRLLEYYLDSIAALCSVERDYVRAEHRLLIESVKWSYQLHRDDGRTHAQASALAFVDHLAELQPIALIRKSRADDRSARLPSRTVGFEQQIDIPDTVAWRIATRVGDRVRVSTTWSRAMVTSGIGASLVASVSLGPEGMAVAIAGSSVLAFGVFAVRLRGLILHPDARRPRQPHRQRLEYVLPLAVVALLVTGTLAIHVSSQSLQHSDSNFYLKRQIVNVGLGSLVMLATMSIDYRRLQRVSPLVILVALIALGAVLVPGIGVETNGALRSIQVGSLPPVAPTELAKVAVLIYMAAWLASRGKVLHDFSLSVIPFVGMVGFVGALVLLEPDLGSSVIIAIITGTLFFLAGARLVHVVALAGSGVLAATLLILSGGYASQWILSFTLAEYDPIGKGFHTLQLVEVFTRGGLTGQGLGAAQEAGAVLPLAQTTGLIAITGAAAGVIGVAFTVALLSVVCWRAGRIALDAADPFGALLSGGITIWFLAQTLMNLSSTTRVIPVTSIAPPFMTFGLAPTVVALAGVGILMSVARHRTSPTAGPSLAESLA